MKFSELVEKAYTEYDIKWISGFSVLDRIPRLSCCVLGAAFVAEYGPDVAIEASNAYGDIAYDWVNMAAGLDPVPLDYTERISTLIYEANDRPGNTSHVDALARLEEEGLDFEVQPIPVEKVLELAGVERGVAVV